MVDIKNIPAKLKSDCRFCAWKFEKRSGQKTKMPYNPANGDRARINDLRTFADFKTTLMSYAMGGYDGIGIAVGNGIGAFDIDHCIREDGTLNDTAATVLSIFPTAYVEKSPSGKGLRGFFCVPEDFVYDKTVYYINNRSKGLEVYMPGATNRFVTVTGDVYRTGEIPNDETAMTTLLDSLMKRSKQVQNTQLRHHSYLNDDAVIAHAEEASNSDKFKRLFAGDWEDLYDSQSDADMALLSILAFWSGCDEEQMDRIFRTSGLMRDMTIIGGHQRLTVAVALGYTEVPCAVVDIDKTREKALNIALNKITGAWDDSLLADLLKDIENSNFDLGKTGFEPPEIATLFNKVHDKDIKEDDFDVESELKQPTFSRAGDLWMLGRHRVLCGDSTKAECYDII